MASACWPAVGCRRAGALDCGTGGEERLTVCLPCCVARLRASASCGRRPGGPQLAPVLHAGRAALARACYYASHAARLRAQTGPETRALGAHCTHSGSPQAARQGSRGRGKRGCRLARPGKYRKAAKRQFGKRCCLTGCQHSSPACAARVRIQANAILQKGRKRSCATGAHSHQNKQRQPALVQTPLSSLTAGPQAAPPASLSSRSAAQRQAGRTVCHARSR